METKNEKKYKESIIGNFFSIVLSFTLSIFLVLIALLIVLRSTVLDQDFLRKEIDKSMYVENVMEEVQKSFKSYGIVSGFDEGFFRSSVTTEALRADIYREVSRIYEGEGIGIDSLGFQKKLYSDLVADVEKRGIETTENVDNALLYLSEVSTGAYVKYAGFPFVSQIGSVLQRVAGIINPVIIAVGFAVLVNAGMVFALTPSRRRKTRCFMYSFGGAFLMIVGGSIAGLYLSGLDRLGISGKALYFLAMTYVKDMAFSFMFGGVVFAFLWFCVLIYRRKVLFGGKVY